MHLSHPRLGGDGTDVFFSPFSIRLIHQYEKPSGVVLFIHDRELLISIICFFKIPRFKGFLFAFAVSLKETDYSVSIMQKSVISRQGSLF